MLERTCEGCGAEITPHSRERNRRRWCSEACRAATYRRSGSVDRQRATDLARAGRERKRAEAGTPIRYGDCTECGSCFVIRPSQRGRLVCSAKCSARRGYRLQLADPERRSRNLASRRDANQRYRAKKPDAVKRSRTKELSSKAYLDRKSRLLGEARLGPRRRAARAKLRKAVRGTRTRIVWASGPCRHCGTQFVGRANGPGGACFCSDRCAAADTRGRRRAQKAGVKLTKGRRYRVFERDEWRCQICGDPLNRDAIVPALDAPTIDHRVPLAAGGAHDESNWQAAHFYCNSVKRDQIGFEFAA